MICLVHKHSQYRTGGWRWVRGLLPRCRWQARASLFRTDSQLCRWHVSWPFRSTEPLPSIWTPGNISEAGIVGGQTLWRIPNWGPASRVGNAVSSYPRRASLTSLPTHPRPCQSVVHKHTGLERRTTLTWAGNGPGLSYPGFVSVFFILAWLLFLGKQPRNFGPLPICQCCGQACKVSRSRSIRPPFLSCSTCPFLPRLPWLVGNGPLDRFLFRRTPYVI